MRKSSADIIDRKTREYLSESGFIVGKTQYWQATPFSKVRPGVRIDLFRCFDYLCIPCVRDGKVGAFDMPILAVQSTVADRVADHRKKALDAAYVVRGHLYYVIDQWLMSGNRFEILAWRQKAKGCAWKLTRWVARLNPLGDPRVSFEKRGSDYEGNPRFTGSSQG